MTRGSAAMASSMVSTMAPVTFSSTISGTEPQRNAKNGVPQAIASIIERPKGSEQSTGSLAVPSQ